MVLPGHRDQRADLRLGVVAPERRRRVGVALDLGLDPQLVELLRRHVLHQPLEPLCRYVDVAGADPDSALAVRGYIGRRTPRGAAVVVQQLEDGPGAVEHAGGGGGGDSDAGADREPVSFRAQHALLGRVLTQHDVPGTGRAAPRHRRLEVQFAGESACVGGRTTVSHPVQHDSGPIGERELALAALPFAERGQHLGRGAAADPPSAAALCQGSSAAASAVTTAPMVLRLAIRMSMRPTLAGGGARGPWTDVENGWTNDRRSGPMWIRRLRRRISGHGTCGGRNSEWYRGT